MSRPFGYKGQEGTCLWCGRKLREFSIEVHTYEGRGDPEWKPPVVGQPYRTWGLVRQVVPYVERGQLSSRRRATPAKPGETPTQYRLYFDPPIWDAIPRRGTPQFDTNTCAMSFGLRMVELGYRLQETSEAVVET